MKSIQVSPNEQLATALRNMGLARIVDSSRVRNFLGIPVRNAKPKAIESKPHIGARVSVIVPAYNVAAYLEDAVGTVQRQTHANLEIVIVNDGSTDATGEIADRIARGDTRVRVIHKPNGGLGAARNTGLSATTGAYVAFVDSDDQLMPDAIEILLRSLEATGSDFAIGAVERFNSTRTWVPEWVDEVHDIPRLGIKAQEHPSVLWDVFVWNKLFRRDIWDARVGLFPEGVLYEDQECTAKLYIEGATFDCLTEPVYRWRFRDDGSSITQNKHSSEDLADRLLVARTVRGVLRGSAHQDLLDTWYAKLLGDDLYWYYREVPRAQDDFWEMLVDAVREFSAEATADAISTIRFDRRLHLLAIVHGSRMDFEKVLYAFQETPGWSTKVLPDGQVVGFVSVIEELSFALKPEQLQVDPSQEPLRVTLLRQTNAPDGGVVFEGVAFVRNSAPTAAREVSARLLLLGEEPDATPVGQIQLPVESVTEPHANLASRDALNDHEAAGFSVMLPKNALEGLKRPGGDSPYATAVLEIGVRDSGAKWRTTEVHLNGAGLLARLVAGTPTETGERFVFEYQSSNLTVTATQIVFLVESALIHGNRVEVAFRGEGGIPETGSSLVLARGGKTFAEAPVEIRGEGEYGAVLHLPSYAWDMKTNYRGTPLEVRAEGVTLGTLGWEATAHRETSDGIYGLAPNRMGELQVERYLQFGEAQEVTLSEDGSRLRVEGFCRFDRQRVRQATPSLMLWSKAHTIYPQWIEYSETSGKFACEFSLATTDVDGAQVSCPMGTYLLGMLLAVGTERPSSFTLLASAAMTESFPTELREQETRVTLQRRPRDGGLEVRLAAPFDEDERGLLAQTRIASRSLPQRQKTNLRPAVLFESFGGRAIGDSPKAIDVLLADQRPDLQRLWTVRDHTVAVPTGATPVLMYSKAWYEALATSQYLVNNNNFPAFFRKSNAQTHIQTWHGTPLKRIGNDVPAANLSLTYRKLMQREATESWDLLLAQTPWAGDVLSQAFGYEGRVFSEGYPRNDALIGPKAGARRMQVRRYLGIGDQQLAVLYAPTWRDNHKGADGKYVRPEFLNPSDLKATFGHGAVMLARGHANHAGSTSAKTGPRVRDVSGYPDINDLYLAADVLVTDYSSVQFDFVNTGKPMVFLAPDLELYRDTVRGFYFDFEQHAPGPIVKTSKEAVAAIADLEQLSRASASQYAAFKERFAYLDDGGATQRLVDLVF